MCVVVCVGVRVGVCGSVCGSACLVSPAGGLCAALRRSFACLYPRMGAPLKGSPRKKLREVCSGPPRGARRQKREREGEAHARERGVGSLTISTISVILPLSGESRVFLGGGGRESGSFWLILIRKARCMTQTLLGGGEWGQCVGRKVGRAAVVLHAVREPGWPA